MVSSAKNIEQTSVRVKATH
jgi:hypothetical protein